jgi:hypothetical protein
MKGLTLSQGGTMIRKVKLALAAVVLVVLVVGGYPAVGAAQAPQISITNSCVWFGQLANGGDGYL